MSFLSCLQCSYCSAEYDAQKIWNLCPACGKPLLARYDLLSASRQFSKSALKERGNSLWRYSEMLPVKDEKSVFTLGEGFTPLLPARKLSDVLGTNIFIKDGKWIQVYEIVGG